MYPGKKKRTTTDEHSNDNSKKSNDKLKKIKTRNDTVIVRNTNQTNEANAVDSTSDTINTTSTTTSIRSLNLPPQTVQNPRTSNVQMFGDWSQFLENGKYSDVTFKVEDRQFKAHRIVLAKASTKFAAMFDQQSAADHVFQITDISVDIFELILKFLYKGGIDLFVISEKVQDLLAASDKYSITELKNECEEFLSYQVCSTNVADYLNLAEKCNANKLKLKAFEIIKKQTAVLAEVKFQKTITRKLEMELIYYLMSFY